MTRVDFYLLDRHVAPEHVIPPIAAKARRAGERLLVVSADEAQLARIGDALWARADAFLANGRAGETHAARQPTLLSTDCAAGNEARLILLADGAWRDEALGFLRALLFFGEAQRAGAQACWRMLGERQDVERRFWKQDGGKRIEGP